MTDLPLTDDTKRWVIAQWNKADSPFETGGTVAYEAAFSYTYPDGSRACVLEVRHPDGTHEQVRIPVSDLEAIAPEPEKPVAKKSTRRRKS